ncbi:MAG: hypothetical protein ACFFCO_12580 [Promethearchaeota archaeon]
MKINWPKACVACGISKDKSPLTPHHYPLRHSQLIGGGPDLYLCPSCHSKARKRYIIGSLFFILNTIFAIPVTVYFYWAIIGLLNVLGAHLSELEPSHTLLATLNQQIQISNALFLGFSLYALLFLSLGILWVIFKRHLTKQFLKLEVAKFEKGLTGLKPSKRDSFFTKFETKVKLYEDLFREANPRLRLP